MSELIGQTLLGQFRVDGFIGSGGMGVVYRIWDLQRDVPLAMKVLHSDLAEDPSILKRFQREARALEKLAHPNIVPFYGLHQAGHVTFLLERYIDGPSLKAVMRVHKGKSLSLSETLSYMKALSSALGYAHAHGVVHCDVKPGNVMVDRGGSIYLTDFGVARHAESTTTTIGFAGTAAYMAPEQIRADPVTAETDVYALGIMLFEMLTGERPFRGTERETESAGPTAAERVRFAHLNLDPPDPSELAGGISADLAAVAMKALAKRPEERFQSTRGFFEALCQAAGNSPELVAERVSVPPRLVRRLEAARAATSAQPISPTQPADVVPPVVEKIPGGRNSLIAAGLGVIVLGGAAILFSGGNGPNEPDGPSAQIAQANSSDVEAGEPAELAFSTPTIAEPTQDLQATHAAQTVEARLTEEAFMTPTPIPGSTWRPFPNCPRSRVRVGDWTRVTLQPPLPNRVRHEPSFDTGTVLGLAQPGEVVEVLDGPVCNEVLWWRVRTEGGLVGWTGEGDYDNFWLDPGSSFRPTSLDDGL